MPDSEMRSPTPVPTGRRPDDQPSHLDWKQLPPDRLELARKLLSDIPLYMESVPLLYWSSDRFYQWLHTYSYSTLAKKAAFTPEEFIEAWTSALTVLYSFPPYGTRPDEIALAYYREMKVGATKDKFFFLVLFCSFSLHYNEQEKLILSFFFCFFQYQKFHIHLLHQLRDTRYKMGWWCCPRGAEAHPDDYTTSCRRDPGLWSWGKLRGG